MAATHSANTPRSFSWSVIASSLHIGIYLKTANLDFIQFPSPIYIRLEVLVSQNHTAYCASSPSLEGISWLLFVLTVRNISKLIHLCWWIITHTKAL